MVAPSVEKIAQLAMELSIDDRRELMLRIARSVDEAVSPSRPVTSLRGIWKDAFPPDFDEEAAIRTARTQWEAEIEPTITGEGEIP